MANPTADFPTAVHTATDVSAFTSSKLGSTTPSHTDLEGKQETELVALQTKIGTGSSTPTLNKVLMGSGTGTSAWSDLPAGGTGDMKADGTVPFTAKVSYDTTKTFSGDLELVDKAYVDGAITAAGGYTDENAQDAVGGILTDTSTVDFTYNDAAGQITADVKDASITLTKQANLAQNTIIGRVTASTGVPEALTAANVRTIINVADGANNYTHPATHSADIITDGTTNKAYTATEQTKLSGIATSATANAKATSAEITTGTDDVKFATAKAIKDAGIVATPTKAAGSDITTGTDDAKFATAKAIKDAGISADLTYVSPSTDHSGSGIKTTLTAGEAVTIGQVCYVKSDGKAWLAKGDASTTMPGCVVALGSISANGSGAFLGRGIVRDDSWSWTVGGLLYISAATG
jgi:hypothetical protein